MESIIDSINPIGRYQKLCMLMVGLVSALSSMSLYVNILNLFEPQLQCIPLSSSSLSNNTYNNTTTYNNQEESNFTIDGDKQRKRDQLCAQFNDTQNFRCYYNTTYFDSTLINEWNLVCSRENVKDYTQMIYLIGSTSAFLSGLVGDKFGRKRASVIFVAIYSLVAIVGQLLISNLVLLNFSVDSRILINYIVQFLCGISAFSMYSSSYVLLIELTTDKYHTLFSNINIYFFVFGELLVLIVYYLSRSWQVANWFICFFSLALTIILALFLPESPRWLIESENTKQACRIIYNMAKFNRAKSIFSRQQLTSSKQEYAKFQAIFNAFLTKSHQNQKRMTSLSSNFSVEFQSKLDELITIKTNNKNNKEEQQQQRKLKLEKVDEETIQDDDLSSLAVAVDSSYIKDDDDDDMDAESFRKLSIREILVEMFWPADRILKLFALTIIWNCVTMNYYGVTMDIINVLKFNPYLNYLLSSLFEIAGIMICHFNDLLGRKKALLIYLALTTVGLLSSSFIDQSDEDEFTLTVPSFAKALLTLLARTMIAAAFNTVYTFTAELYEIKIRSTVVLFLNCIGCVGSFLSPLVNALRKSNQQLPYLLYGIFTLGGCLTLLMLPETYNNKLNKQKKIEKRKIRNRVNNT